jgi:DNA repair protein RadC
MSLLTATQLAQIPEVSVSFHPHTPRNRKRPIVDTSQQAHQVFLHCWDKSRLEYEERLYVLLLNSKNAVLGVHHHSTGGRIQTSVDIAQIFGLALKANATKIILAHNHPSGNLTPSRMDMNLTREVKAAADIVKVKFIDHLILTKDRYLSLSDDGLL